MSTWKRFHGSTLFLTTWWTSRLAPRGTSAASGTRTPHASIYAHPKVFKALREIAAAADCKSHDLYIEGLRMVLRQHGRDFDALNRGE